MHLISKHIRNSGVNTLSTSHQAFESTYFSIFYLSMLFTIYGLLCIFASFSFLTANFTIHILLFLLRKQPNMRLIALSNVMGDKWDKMLQTLPAQGHQEIALCTKSEYHQIFKEKWISSIKRSDFLQRPIGKSKKQLYKMQLSNIPLLLPIILSSVCWNQC